MLPKELLMSVGRSQGGKERLHGGVPSCRHGKYIIFTFCSKELLLSFSLIVSYLIHALLARLTSLTSIASLIMSGSQTDKKRPFAAVDSVSDTPTEAAKR